MRQLIAAVAVALLLQGCSTFTRPIMKPVIEDRISTHHEPTIGVLATTAERRVFLAKMPDNTFCAEPPPDAADNISSALNAVAQGTAKGNISEASLGFATTLATSVQRLFVRSQGIQLYRDGIFMLCTSFLNGAISGEELIDRQQKLLELVVPLIAQEIPLLHQVVTAPLPAAPVLGNVNATRTISSAVSTPGATTATSSDAANATASASAATATQRNVASATSTAASETQATTGTACADGAAEPGCSR